MRRSRRFPLEKLQPYLLEIPPDPAPAPLDGAAVFGNDRPVEIEVGFGKGMFLLAASGAQPDTNFLGIEVERAYQLYAANRLAKRNRANVRLACTDARVFFRDRLAGQSVQAIHVYFPDPWWKKRHHKRRLFSGDFAAQCGRCLKTGGMLYLASDVEEYFHIILDLVGREKALSPASLPPLAEPRHDLDYLTNFERKYRKEARPIHRAVFRKLPIPD